MFTGFASENTPAIQVWDSFSTFTGTNRIALADDCAPIQFFKTGGNTTAISLYLPSAPIEGKQIQISNAKYGGSNQSITVFSSDVSAGGTSNSIATLGTGQTLVFCYSKQFISFGTSVGSRATGWITLNQSPAGSVNNYAFVSGGNANSASGTLSFVGGGNTCTASGNNSFIGGGVSSTANGTNSFVGGGSTGSASGSQSFIAGGTSNTAGGANAFIGGGDSNTASSSGAFVGGGSTNIASGLYGFIGGGNSSTSSSTNSFVGGGASNLANASNSSVVGGAYGSTRLIVGNTVAPASITPIAGAAGVTQSAILVLGVQTTDATATILRSNTSAATTTNQVILPNNSAYVFQGTCIANVTGGSTTSGWKYEGVIKRGANAASTTLVAAVTPTVIAQDLAAATWVLAITADTTNGGIAVTVTGAAATTIRWVSRIETTEVTF
jgi:hypothetical protein